MRPFDRPARAGPLDPQIFYPLLSRSRRWTIWAVLLLLVSSGLMGAIGGLPPAHAPGHLSGAASSASTPLMQARASLDEGHGPASMLGATQHLVHSLTSPSSGLGVAMAYDAADGYVLAVSPNVTGTGNNSTWGSIVQTWTFLHGNWTQLSLSYAPEDRGYESIAYDPVDKYVVIYGGSGFGGGFFGGGGLLDDTWSYSAGNWTNITVPNALSPGLRAYAPMTWDTADGYGVLVAGMGTSGNITGNLSDTWTFVGGNWTPSGKAAGLQPQGTMAYDAMDGYVVYFGGTYYSGTSNETWKFKAGTWTSLTSKVTGAPPSRANAAMTYDPNLGALLLFGGIGQNPPPGWTYYNDTWSYANLTWTLLSSASGPSPREQSSLVFDAADNESLLFGGVNYSSNEYSDTWAFGNSGNGSSGNSSSWVQAAPHVHVSRGLIDLGYAVTFTVGGVQGTGESYSYVGLPPGCADTNAASLTCVPSVTGNFTVVSRVTTSAGIASAVTALSVVPDPSLGSFSATPTLTETGGRVTFAVAAEGGQPPFSYAYTGLPASCLGADQSTLACVPSVAGFYTVVVTASDSLGFSATSSVAVQVLPGLSIAAVRLSQNATDVGLSTVITGQLTGGLGPFTYAYSSLPTGCSSVTASSVSCTPTTPGVYSPVLQVTDWLGFSATGSAQLTVNPDPTIESLDPSAAKVVQGDAWTLGVSASGGTGALTYSYQGLPPECASADTPVLSCTASTVGNYTVTVTATDSLGVAGSAITHLEVAPTPIGPTHGGGPGGGGGGGSSPPVVDSATLFIVGVALGLVGLAVGIGVLLWRARLVREGHELVRELREGTDGESRPAAVAASGPVRGNERRR